MRKLLAALATSMLLVLLPVSAGAITNGELDHDGHPFVGMLAFYDGPDGTGNYLHRCTGTLMSPTVVLTASHCTSGTMSARIYFTSTVPDDFRTVPGGVVGTSHTHPAYNPNNLRNDVAVVVLNAGQSVPPGPYPTLPSQGFLSRLKRQHKLQDDTFLAVGYGGQTTWPPPNLEFELDRRFSVSPYGGLTQNNLHLLQNPNPADAGGTCFGDSGGPHFWKDTLKVVSVTSWGDAICRSNDMTQRTDLASVLGFLAGYGL
jgi:secreted trypsin-like serine protease